MSKVALYVPLEAKPGKEKEVAEFLKSALPLVDAEPGTITWFAIQEGPSSFAIFDTFDDEAGLGAFIKYLEAHGFTIGKELPPGDGGKRLRLEFGCRGVRGRPCAQPGVGFRRDRGWDRAAYGRPPAAGH